MRYLLLVIFAIVLFPECSKSKPEMQVYSASISTVDQQTLKGWGCCPLWIGNLEYGYIEDSISPHTIDTIRRLIDDLANFFLLISADLNHI